MWPPWSTRRDGCWTPRPCRLDPCYVALVTWAECFGPVARIGVEGTGTYGAGLARFARAYGLQVLEVDRPDRSTRRRRGKSDPIDAQAAARVTLAGWPPPPPRPATARWR